MPTVSAESHVVVGRAGDIKLERIAKDFFVAVGRWVQQENPIAFVDREAIDDNILGGGAIHVSNWRGPTQHLFNRIG